MNPSTVTHSEFEWCIIVYPEFCNKKVWTTLQLHTFEFCNKEVWCCCSNCCQQPTVQPQLLVCQSLRQTTIKQITVKITRKQESRTLVKINRYPPPCAWIQERVEFSSCCVSTQISKLSRQLIFFVPNGISLAASFFYHNMQKTWLQNHESTIKHLVVHFIFPHLTQTVKEHCK